MKHTPIVSVIVPVYNRQHLIERSINTILQQSFQNFEICIINDGSTDNTQNIINNIKDHRIRIFEHSFNKGVSAARNTGINNAHGEYIAFLDSDDEWLTNKLEKQVNLLNNISDNLEKTCFTGYFLNREILYKNDEQSCEVKGGLHANYLLKGCFLSPGSTLVAHKSIFDVIGMFDENLKRCEDWDWLIRHNACNLKIQTILEPLAKINIQSKPSLKSLKVPLYYLKEKHISNLQLKDRMIFSSSLLIELSSAALYEKRFFLFIHYAIRSLLFYPFRSFQFFKKVLRNSVLFVYFRVLKSNYKIISSEIGARCFKNVRS